MTYPRPALIIYPDRAPELRPSFVWTRDALTELLGDSCSNSYRPRPDLLQQLMVSHGVHFDPRRTMVFVADSGLALGFRVNVIATALYGVPGMDIVGTAVVMELRPDD